jgi:TatD DNase family protein
MLIHDTHAHLDYYLKLETALDPQEVIKNHKFWIQPGVNIERDTFCLENYLRYDNMYFMIGAHPEISNEKNFDLEEFLIQQQVLIAKYEKYLEKKIIAIGEIGLDYRIDTSQEQKDIQKLLFEIEIKLAKELNLPFVIHCRDAFDDTLEIIKKCKPYKKPFLFHCFTGNIGHYKIIEELGGYVAFGGIVTYKNTFELQEVAKIAKNYVIETDLPWLAPTPFRGKLNKPEYIINIFEYVSNLRKTSIDDVIKDSEDNSCKIFNLTLTKP